MRKIIKVLAGATVAILAAGCGSSGNSGTAMQPPPPAADSFTQTVQGIVSTASETAEPVAIDGIAAISSDDAPPMGI
jgi:hypothetical protein